MVVPSRIAKSCTAAPLPCAREAQHVELRPREGRHLLDLHRPLDGAQLVAHVGRPLVVGRVRGRRHLLAQAPRDQLLSALEEEHHLLDVGAVVVLGDGLDARALAALDVVQQARPRQRALAFLDLDRARPEREQAADEVHRLVDAAGADAYGPK